MHGLASHSRIPVAKRKFDKAVDKLKDSVANVYDVDICELRKSDLADTSTNVSKAADLDRLTLLMKEKYRHQVLTKQSKF